MEAKEKAKAQAYNESRGTTAERGYDFRWQKVRIQAKEAGRWLCQCSRCVAMGRIKKVGKSDPVHHIKPVDKYPGLRLSLSNLVSMTRHCHEVEEGRAHDFEFERWERKSA